MSQYPKRARPGRGRSTAAQMERTVAVLQGLTDVVGAAALRGPTLTAMLLLGLVAWPAAPLAAPGPAPVPQRQIPPAVLAALRTLDNQFDLALAQDCAPERCFSKGCVYAEHVVIDRPRSTSLPGIGEEAGPGSVNAQEYLTQARCEFTHERSVPTRDVQALVKRLEQKLSRGWMMVSVGHEPLAPVSAGLREPPSAPEAPPQEEPEAAAMEPPAPVPEWSAATALRELWASLLPHFSWMIAIVLGTIAALILIWGARRLGRESLEDKALLAQLERGEAQPAEREAAGEAPAPAPAAVEPAAKEKSLAELGDEQSFVDAQMRLWSERIDKTELAEDGNVVNDLLREWLRAGEFPLLTKAVFVFSDRLPLAFPEDGELAVRKIELADYIRTVDERRLPSDAEFFRKLNHHAVSSSLLSHADAEVLRSLREEFGSGGVARLIELLPPRHGALLFALTPADAQHEVSRILSQELRCSVAEQLLLSNRIAKEETAEVFAMLRAVRDGQELPQRFAHSRVSDRGREFDAAGALSVLLPHVAPAERSALFAAALERSSGALPLWYEQILYADMLLKVPGPLQMDLLLDVDIRSLAGWFSVQAPTWRDGFMTRLAPSMQNALRASMAFASRADELALARRGQSELAAALQKLVARGQISFTDVVI